MWWEKTGCGGGGGGRGKNERNVVMEKCGVGGVKTTDM